MYNLLLRESFEDSLCMQACDEDRITDDISQREIGPVYIILTCDFQPRQQQMIALATRRYCERSHRHFVDFHAYYETLSSLQH